jgi:hypothetical protein
MGFHIRRALNGADRNRHLLDLIQIDRAYNAEMEVHKLSIPTNEGALHPSYE